jgi:hypothetical protein
MRAITVKQPWAYAIFHAGKNIENRKQNILAPTPLQLAIHVSKTPDLQPKLPRGFGYIGHLREAYDPDLRGMIIGVVTLKAVCDAHDSIWYQGGRRAYVLSNPRLLVTPLPARGFQSHWEVPSEILKKFRYR